MGIMIDKSQRGTMESAPTRDRETTHDEDAWLVNAEQEYSAAEISGPAFVLMAGFAGAGKTTLATTLNNRFLQHDQLKWIMLNKDVLKRERLAKGEEVESAGWSAYEDLFEQITCEVIKKGESAIIDTSNERPFIHENIENVLKQMKHDHVPVRLQVILCVANRETREKRLNTRGSVFAPYVQEIPSILDDSELLERFQHLFVDDKELLDHLQRLSNNSEELEQFNYLKSDKALIVNTNHPLEDYVDDVWREINTFLKKSKPGAE